MKTFTWQRLNWWATRFLVALEPHPVGQLRFPSSWNWDAEYTDADATLRFTQPSAWNSDVRVTQGEVTVGTIRGGWFGSPSLTLASGECFVLATSTWQQEAAWKTADGAILVTFQQATWSARSTGAVPAPDALPPDLERLLVSSGIFLGQLRQKRTALIFAFLLLASASRH